MFAEKNILTKARTDPGGALRARSGVCSNPRRSRAMRMDFSTGCQVMGNRRCRLCLTGWQFGRRANCNSKRRRPGICQAALSGAVGP